MSTPLDGFDVAFSFLAADHDLAERLASAVRAKLRPFVFSEAQKDIAGKDGASVFTRLFEEDASLVVVLYRSGYGSTQWTRLEESAITSRGVKHGWDRVLVISLDGKKPPWIPGSRLWFGLEQFGFDAAVDTILARHGETGRESRPETALDRARHLASRAEREQEAQRIGGSEAGVSLARAAVDDLWHYLDEQAGQINSSAQAIGARVSTPSRDVRYFDSDGARMSFGWSLQYSNTLEGANLLVRHLEWPRERHFDDDPQWQERSSDLWVPVVNPDNQLLAWREHGGSGTLLSTRDLAERYLMRLFERRERER